MSNDRQKNTLSPAPELTLTPIGIARTAMLTKFEAPHQPDVKADTQRNTIELNPGHNYEAALRNLEGFDRIWLIWWFHKNDTWRPMVLPPRGPGTRRGLFATRSPHRPNPIGMTCTTLHRISGLTLEVGELDLVDGTPILDIKPYLPEVDAFPDSSSGWLSEVQEYLSTPPSYTVAISDLAKEQLNWLKEKFNEDFLTRATEILERDPSPHRTRRIRKRKAGGFLIGCGPWRLHFSLNHKNVQIEQVLSGYPMRLLLEPGYDKVPSRDALLAFIEKWPSGKIS